MQMPQIDVGVSPEVLRQIAEAEAKVAGRESSPQSLKDIERQMVRSLPTVLLCMLFGCCNASNMRVCFSERYCSMLWLLPILHMFA